MSTEALSAAGHQATEKAFLKANKAFLGPDPEIMRDHHLAPRSAREEKILAAAQDHALHAELRLQLQAALDETFDIAEMTVATPAAQCGDMSTAIFTASGDSTLVSTRGVAGFSVSLHYPIRYIRKYFENDPTVGVHAGDGFLINDCRFGGIHSPDQHLFMPVFSGAELIAWVCCAMHEGEIGAKVPGGMGPTIESKWDEGFKGSPIKLVENYRLKTDLVTLVQNNSREPQIILADLKARLAACRRIEQRIFDALQQYGDDAVIGFFRANIEFVREETRRRIREMPDGTVRVRLFCDDTMREPALMNSSMAFTKKNDRIVLDLRGAAPQFANRPINSLRQSQTVTLLISLMHYVWPDLPSCQALLEQFDLVTDPGSFVDCDQEVPVALCMQPMFKVITAAELAFSKFYYGMPKRYAKIKAGWFNQPQTIIYGGLNQHMDSVGNMCGDLNGMAGGAKCDADGEHSLAPNFGAYTDIGEAEHAEENLPFIYAISKKIWPDNCGFGKYRGGSAYQYGLMRFGTQPFGFQTFTGGSYFPSTQGLFGGYACPVYAVARIRGKNLLEEMKTKPDLFQASMEYLMNERPFAGATYEALPMAVPFEFYAEGELFMMSQGAGGGYGDVLERDPELVMKDLREGLISPETARDIYCVAYEEALMVVDAAGTAERRQAERQARKARGMRWDEFLAKKVKPQPPSDILYFGSWNSSKEIFAGPYGKGLPGQLPPIYMPDPIVVENQRLQARIAELEAQAKSPV
ncbi:MAG: hydantoinase B/oxoprolinase family protein [Sterolibacterium sp.]